MVWLINKDAEKNGDTGNAGTSASCALPAQRWRKQTAGKTLEGNNLAPQVGFEPTTLRLTEGRSAFFTVATGCYK